MSSRVYVGMSGGVDSSVTAALLKEQGHDVTGVYMKNWTRDLPGMHCPWAEDLADAKRVATQLEIPLKIFDFEKEYKQKVVDYMVAEYAAGRTPNPDIMCNQEVKFKLFLEAALEDGAEKIATGHYAATDGKTLFTAKDSNKDQTYFLYRITKNALKHTLFPLGNYTKDEIRAMAKSRGLATAGKKDSQGICFVGQIGMKDFLSQYVETKPGEIIDQNSGKVIGTHEGAIFYTLGQRHGLGIGGGLPYYVAGKDMAKNIVYATKKLNDESLWQKNLHLTSLHWINAAPENENAENLHVRLRHRAPLAEVQSLAFENENCIVTLKEQQRAATPGQSVVFYRGNETLGGGIIV